MSDYNRLAARLAANRMSDQGNSDAAHPSTTNKMQAQAPVNGRRTLADQVNQHSPSPRYMRKEEPKEEEQPYQYSDSSSMNEILLEAEHLKEIQAQRERQKRWKMSTRIINGLLIIGCVYVVFLIFGAAMTDYHYNDDGSISAQRMSVSDIKSKREYETILVLYENCRNLYENTLMLDYRLGAGEEDPLTIAPEYEALLDDVTDLSVKTDAATVASQYAQIKDMMVSWIQNDIAVYLQNMSAAISENNSETANNALQDKDRLYENFSLITQNVVATGKTIPGIDLSDIMSWTPDNYVNDTIKSTNQ